MRVESVKLNKLHYNPNRSLQPSRRTVGEAFHIQAYIHGSGTAQARFAVGDRTPCEETVLLPGIFECELAFDSPGSRVGTLSVEADGQRFQQSIRLDTLEHEWVG